MSRVLIRDPTYYGPFTAMRMGGRSRRHVVVRRRSRRRRMRSRRRRDGTWIHNLCHSLTYSAANRRSSLRELERSPTAGAGHQHRRRRWIVHRRISKPIKRIQNLGKQKFTNDFNRNWIFKKDRLKKKAQLRWLDYERRKFFELPRIQLWFRICQTTINATTIRVTDINFQKLFFSLLWFLRRKSFASSRIRIFRRFERQKQI